MAATDRLLRFGNVLLDRAEHRLERDGERIEVQPLVFRAILMLADHPDRVLPKDELFSALWPDRVVGDAALARVIKEARAALADDAGNPRFIRTAPRVGYQWIAAPDRGPAPGGEPGAGRRLAALALVMVLAIPAFFAWRGSQPPSEPEPEAASATPDVTELQALRYYEQGRAALRSRDRAELERAVALFEQALEVDPGLAAAMAGIAVARAVPVNVPQSVLQEARNLLQRALEIDPEDSLTHAGLGMLDINNPERWDLAEERLRRALELDPDNGEALNWLAILHGNRGRLREAVTLRRKALLRDPTHTGLAGNLAVGLIGLGRFEEARELLDPRAWGPENIRGLRHARQSLAAATGRPDEVLRITLEVLARHPDSIDIQGEAVRVLVQLGLDEDATLIYRRARPCIPPRALMMADLEQALATADAAVIRETAAPFFANLEQVPPFAVTTVATAALVVERPDLAQALLAARFPDAAAIRGERGSILHVLRLAMIAVEAARRLEDGDRLREFALKIEAELSRARENGYQRQAQLSVLEAQVALALGDAERAAERLAAAIAEGWWDWWVMAQGPVWLPLREREALAPLFERVRARQLAHRDQVMAAAWYPGAADWPLACPAPSSP